MTLRRTGLLTVVATLFLGSTAGPAKVSNRMVIDENGRWIEHTDVVVNNGPPQRVVEMRLSKGQ